MMQSNDDETAIISSVLLLLATKMMLYSLELKFVNASSGGGCGDRMDNIECLWFGNPRIRECVQHTHINVHVGTNLPVDE